MLTEIKLINLNKMKKGEGGVAASESFLRRTFFIFIIPYKAHVNANQHPTILYCLILANIFSSSSPPNQVFLCLIGRRLFKDKPTYGSLIGNNIRDVRNWSRRISRSKSYRRMRFYKNNHLKTDLDGCYSH